MKNKKLKFIILILLEFAMTGLQAQTNNFGTFTDLRDGNIYKWVKIGNQIWMAENLKYLPRVSKKSESSDEYYCFYVYDYDSSSVSLAKQTTNYKTYGVLYNWPAAMYKQYKTNIKDSLVQGICPDGWHLPNNKEWQILINYMGGDTVAGNKLKEIGNNYWKYRKDVLATNSSGFNALPGGEFEPLGKRNFYGFIGMFYSIGMYGEWWTSTIDKSEYHGAHIIMMTFENGDASLVLIPKANGISVRCIKN